MVNYVDRFSLTVIMQKNSVESLVRRRRARGGSRGTAEDVVLRRVRERLPRCVVEDGVPLPGVFPLSERVSAVRQLVRRGSLLAVLLGRVGVRVPPHVAVAAHGVPRTPNQALQEPARRRVKAGPPIGVH
jgi:hypothetical protein